MADENAIEAVITADITEFRQGMREVSSEIELARQSFDDINDAQKAQAERTKNVRDAWKDTGEVFLKVGAAMAVGIGFAVKTYADFEKAVSNFKAVAEPTNREVQELTRSAMELGREFGVSATDVMNAATELNKAGVSTADIMGGALAGALSLAAAGEMEVAVAGEAAAIAMTQFGLAGRDVPHIADLLAAGAAVAVGEVSDLVWALRQAGLVAGNMGVSVEETIGSLTAFARAGLIGSDAGTSFKSMLMAISAPSGVARKEMERLGISFYDAEKNFVGVAGVAEILSTRLGHLSQETRDAAMATIFGQDAVRAATVLMNEGAAGMAATIDEIDRSGFAAEVAREKLDNLTGDVSKLGVAFTNNLIKSGSGVNEMLRDVVQSATGLLDLVGKMDPALLQMGFNFAAAATAGLLLAGGVMTIVPRIAETIDVFKRLNEHSSTTAGILGKVGKAAGLAAAGFAAFEIAKVIHNSMQPATVSVEKFGMALIGLEDNKNAINDVFANIEYGKGDRLAGEVHNVGAALKEISDPGFWSGAAGFGADLGIDNGIAKLRQGIEDLDSVLAAQVQGGNLDLAATAFKNIQASADESGLSLDQYIDKFPHMMDALRSAGSSTGEYREDAELLAGLLDGSLAPAIETAAGTMQSFGSATGDTYLLTEDMSEALEEMGINLDGVITNMENFLDLLFATGLATMSSRDATRRYSEAIAEVDELQASLAAGTGPLGQLLNDLGTDFNSTSEAGIAAGRAFDGVSQAGINQAKAMATAGESHDAIQTKIEDTYNDLIREAGQFDITGQAADDLARSVLGVPDGVDIKTWMADTAKRMADDTKLAVERIPPRKDVEINIKETTFRDIVFGPGYKTASERAAEQSTGVLAPRMATGGAVIGPGTGTSDEVPRWLSNGEHVWTAAEVANAGGHNAVEQLRKAARQGINPFAVANASAGMATAMRIPVAAPAATTAASAGPTTLEGKLYLDSGELLGVVRGVVKEGVDKAYSDLDTNITRIGRGGVYVGGTR